MFGKSLKSAVASTMKDSVEVELSQDEQPKTKKIVSNFDFAFTGSLTLSSLVVKNCDKASALFEACNLELNYLVPDDPQSLSYFLSALNEVRKNGIDSTIEIGAVHDITLYSKDFICMLLGKEDLESLPDTSRWLNDNIINSYCELLARSKLTHSNIIILSSFFYSKITEDKKYDFLKGKRFTYESALFSKKVVLVPVFVKTNHWAVVAIYLELKSIFYIDSLQYDGTKILKVMLNWLFDEYNRIHSSFMSVEGWNLVNSNVFLDKTQKNGYDCGVRCLMNLEHLSRNFMLPGGDEEDAKCYRFHIGSSVFFGQFQRILVLHYSSIVPMEVEVDKDNSVPMEVVVNDVNESKEVVVKNELTNSFDPKSIDLDCETVTSKTSVKTRSRTNSIGSGISLQDGGGVYDISYNRKQQTDNWKHLINYLNMSYKLQIEPVSGGPNNTCLYTSINRGLIKHNKGRGVGTKFKGGDVILKTELRQYMLSNERAITKQFCETFLVPVFEPILGNDGIQLLDENYPDRAVPLTRHSRRELEIDGFLFVNMAGEFEEELLYDGQFDFNHWVDETLQLFGNESVLRCMCSMLNADIVVFTHNIVYNNTPMGDQRFLADYDRRQILVDPESPDTIKIPIIYNGYDHYSAARKLDKSECADIAKKMRKLGFEVDKNEDVMNLDCSALILRDLPLVKNM
jgi:hypothetical protein